MASEGPIRSIAREYGLGWKHLVGAVAVLGAVGLLLVAKSCHDTKYSRTGPGELRGAHLVTLADGGAAITLTTNVHHEHGGRGGGERWDQPRLETVDLRSGVPLGRVLVDHGTQCIRATPGLVWCGTSLVSGPELHLRDAATLAVKVTNAQLLAGGPKLAKEQRVGIDRATAEAYFATADGRFWKVSPGLHGEIVDVMPEGLLDVSGNRSSTTSSISLAKGYLGFQGSPRASLVRSDGREGSWAIAPEQKFLHPEFLVEDEGPARGSPAALVSGELYFVVHDETVDHGSSPQLVTAIGLDGLVRWTVPINRGEVRGAWLVNGELVLALTLPEAAGALISIVVATGTVRVRVAT